MTTLSKAERIWTLDLGDDENRFSPTLLEAVEGHLEEIATSKDAVALVTTGSGKFFSNGLDLDWLGQNPREYSRYVDRVHALLSRVLTLPVPTVAALNGHAFGAGAMLAMAHDHRVMRIDRGYICFPEVDIRIPFTPGMSALITSKLSPRAAMDAMTSGHRYPASEALGAGLVDAITELDRLPRAAASRVAHLAGKDRTTLGAIKSTMFDDAVARLAVPV